MRVSYSLMSFRNSMCYHVLPNISTCGDVSISELSHITSTWIDGNSVWEYYTGILHESTV